MARKTKQTEEQRIGALEEYMKGEGSRVSLAKKYGMSKTTLHVSLIFIRPFLL